MSERRLEVAEQRVSCILVRQDRFRRLYGPVYAEFRVGDGYSTFRLGAIQVVALILKYGGVAEHGESVSETTGNKELSVIAFG